MDLFDKVIFLDREATDFGFTWEHPAQLMDQLLSECDEVNEVLHQPERRHHLEEELGDLIFTAIALCVYCKFDPKNTLAQSLDKFEKRFAALKTIAAKEGFETLHDQPMELLQSLWNKAKRHVPHQRE
jgi:uncharacterized protein YabN with tetrapyrrole methylase and pyrophosphatase domain